RGGPGVPGRTGGGVRGGSRPGHAAKRGEVRRPRRARFARRGAGCTPPVVEGFEKGMRAAGKSLELFRYDAEHAFVNEQRQAVHDREAAELAWGRATEFFRKHLG